jgi:hypothetical protein
MLRDVSDKLRALGVQHTYVEGATKPFEEMEQLHAQMDEYVEGVVDFLKKLASSGKQFKDNLVVFDFDDLGLKNKKLKSTFGKLRISLFTPVTIEPGSGLPLGGNLRDPKSMFRGGYFPPTGGGKLAGSIALPYLEPNTGKVMQLRVNSFHCHQLVAHETQHYLDYSGLNPEVENVERLVKETPDIPDWYSRETEFNAVVREITHSVRRFLRLLEKDQSTSKPKFKPAKIHALFGVQFSKLDMFLESVFASMENRSTPTTIFEFGKDSHCKHVVQRYKGYNGVYRFKQDFDDRLKELWKYVVDWYKRADRKYHFSKAK